MKWTPILLCGEIHNNNIPQSNLRQLTEENHLFAPKPINHINQSISQEGKDHE